MNLETTAFLGPIGTPELVVAAVIALLIFGKRLPDVARSVGKSIVEFKRGIKDVKDDIDDRSRLEPPNRPRIEARPAGDAGESVDTESRPSPSNAAADKSARQESSTPP